MVYVKKSKYPDTYMTRNGMGDRNSRRSIYQTNSDDELDQVRIVERSHFSDDKSGSKQHRAGDV